MNYVQQDLFWLSLMAMPANLTFFCLASTYDTLSSPTNFKRCRITTETMCTLCSKDVYTTGHILGACKVSLEQGRYKFRNNTVLGKVIEAIKTFILNIKEVVRIFNKSSMFVKKRSKIALQKDSIIRYFTSCIRLFFLVLFLFFLILACQFSIAFNKLRPYITIFLKSLRKVILIKLTCPCEENMESWPGTKISKYLALNIIIEYNG